jgi:hypothetical protein
MPRRWTTVLIALIALSATVLSLLTVVSVAGAADVSDQARNAAPIACAELISNGGFEAQGTGWTQSSVGGFDLISTFYPRTGSWGAYLGGANNADDRVSQQIIVPSNPISVSLTAWWAIATEEPGAGFDRMTISLLQPNGALLQDLFTVDSSATVNLWDQAEADLTQYAGQTIVLRFRATTNASSPTDFYVDDISVVACPPAKRIYLPLVLREGG